MKKPLGAFILDHEPAARVVLILAGFAGVVALTNGSLLIAVVLPPAIVMQMFVLTWSWWRISETFFTFLRDYTRFAPVKDGGKDKKG